MTFIHQNEIVPLKCIDGEGLIALFVLEFVDVEDLYRLPGEQPPPILIEEFG